MKTYYYYLFLLKVMQFKHTYVLICINGYINILKLRHVINETLNLQECDNLAYIDNNFLIKYS